VLTDGEDTASMVDDEQLIDLARRSGVVIYTIGLLTPTVGGMRPSTMPTYVLTVLARETGGRAYFPRSLVELDGTYDRIASDLRTLYGVGYVPLNPRADGGFRRIAIQTRLPGLLVRHRTGYYAPGSGRDTLRLLRATSR
jgi:Ca-activated chloride channel family protein